MSRHVLLLACLGVAACGRGRFSEAVPSAEATDVSVASWPSNEETYATATARFTAAEATTTDVNRTDASAVGPAVEPARAESTFRTSATSAVTSTTEANAVDAAAEVGTPGSTDPISTAADAGSEAATRDQDRSTAAAHSGAVNLETFAAGFHELEIHDECTDDKPADEECAHARSRQVSFTFGGQPDTTYDVTLRMRGLFEPTHVRGGTTPYPQHPYFKVGGNVTKLDSSHWTIQVTEPDAVFHLNHYPQVAHAIYQQDFEVTIAVRGGAQVTVGVQDGNDRRVDHAYFGLPERQQAIDGVTNGAPDGQFLRIDVLGVSVSR